MINGQAVPALLHRPPGVSLPNSQQRSTTLPTPWLPAGSVARKVARASGSSTVTVIATRSAAIIQSTRAGRYP